MYMHAALRYHEDVVVSYFVIIIQVTYLVVTIGWLHTDSRAIRLLSKSRSSRTARVDPRSYCVTEDIHIAMEIGGL